MPEPMAALHWPEWLKSQLDQGYHPPEEDNIYMYMYMYMTLFSHPEFLKQGRRFLHMILLGPESLIHRKRERALERGERERDREDKQTQLCQESVKLLTRSSRPESPKIFYMETFLENDMQCFSDRWCPHRPGPTCPTPHNHPREMSQ